MNPYKVGQTVQYMHRDHTGEGEGETNPVIT